MKTVRITPVIRKVNAIETDGVLDDIAREYRQTPNGGKLEIDIGGLPTDARVFIRAFAKHLSGQDIPLNPGDGILMVNKKGEIDAITP